MPFFRSERAGLFGAAKLLHGKEAELRVARQLGWALTRSNEQEIAFWDAVLKDLDRNALRH